MIYFNTLGLEVLKVLASHFKRKLQKNLKGEKFQEDSQYMLTSCRSVNIPSLKCNAIMYNFHDFKDMYE